MNDNDLINQIMSGNFNEAATPSNSPAPSSNVINQIMSGNFNTPTEETTAPESISSWKDFTKLASNIVSQRGLPSSVLPVLLAQAADESARGTAAPGNNYFGIKGQGDAGSNDLATQEYQNGGYQNENSGFAAYNSPQDSINAYLDLIMGYKGVPEAMQSNDPQQLIQAIEANGYATSPTYVNTIENEPEFGGNYGSN